MIEGKEYIGTVTSKGQVTIPIEVREQLGLAPLDKVVFRVTRASLPAAVFARIEDSE